MALALPGLARVASLSLRSCTRAGAAWRGRRRPRPPGRSRRRRGRTGPPQGPKPRCQGPRNRRRLPTSRALCGGGWPLQVWPAALPRSARSWPRPRPPLRSPWRRCKALCRRVRRGPGRGTRALSASGCRPRQQPGPAGAMGQAGPWPPASAIACPPPPQGGPAPPPRRPRTAQRGPCPGSWRW